LERGGGAHWESQVSSTRHRKDSCFATSRASVKERFCQSSRILWVFGHPCWSAVARLRTSNNSAFAALPCPLHGEYAAGWCPQPTATHWCNCLALLSFSALLICRRDRSRLSGYESNDKGLVMMRSMQTSVPLSQPMERMSAGWHPSGVATYLAWQMFPDTKTCVQVSRNALCRLVIPFLRQVTKWSPKGFDGIVKFWAIWE